MIFRLTDLAQVFLNSLHKPNPLPNYGKAAIAPQPRSNIDHLTLDNYHPKAEHLDAAPFL